MKTSLIITTLNEASNLAGLLEDVFIQTKKPDELVVIDGGSSDGTVELVRTYQNRLGDAGIGLVLSVDEGVNIAQGRNIAIAAASHEVICGTDAGCRLAPDWLEKITQPILRDDADFVGGFYRPVAHSTFQRTLASVTVAARPPAGFLPSSRSIAFTKALWRRVGGYPEWLKWGEDTLFNELCLRADARYVVASDAIVYWEVRPSFSATITQFYRYAVGDGQRRRMSGSHLANSAVFFAALILAVAANPFWLSLVLVYVLVLILRRRSGLRGRDFPLAFLLVLCIRAARAWGWILGLLGSFLRRECVSGRR